MPADSGTCSILIYADLFHSFSMPARSREGVRFIEPMECLAVAKLPDGPQWVYEINLDGCRTEAVRSSDGLTVHSRNGRSLNKESRTPSH
jgi:bifunctional non-homologous end joining protein LigD